MVAYSEPKRITNVPIVDLKDTFSGDNEARRAAAKTLREACHGTGFFYVTNHGIDERLIASLFQESKDFFDLPDATKLKYKKRPGTNGYEPVASQQLDPDAPSDFKESFNISKPGIPGSPDHVDNLWPAERLSLRVTLEEYHEAIRGVALHISRMIALSLDMPVDYFDHMFDNQRASLRLLKYPPMPKAAEANQLGAGAHTDFGWITIVAQDDKGGLEVETASGDWIVVDPIPGTFVVNLGDLVPEWTNGYYHSSLHRVLNKRPDKDRYSVVLFYNPRFETVVETVPTCLAPGEAPRKPFVSGEHRQARGEASRRAAAAKM